MSTTVILLFQAAVPLLLLLGAWLMPALTAPTLPFGVRVPAERVEEPVIAAQRGTYRRWVALAGGAVLLAGTAWGLSSGSLLTPAVTTCAVLAVDIAGYLRAHRAISAVKQREAWFRGLRQGVVADTSLRTDPARLPWAWTLPPVLLTAGTLVAGILRYPSMPDRLPTHYNGAGRVDHFAAKSVGSAFAPVLAQLALTVLLILLCLLVFRARPDLEPARAKVTADQHRRFLTRMARCLLLLTACADLSIAVAAWQIWRGDHEIAVLPVLLPLVLALGTLLVVAIRSGQNGSRIPVSTDGTVGTVGTDDAQEQQRPAGARVEDQLEHQDDDRHWRLGGLVYLNREDSALFVPKRFGFGWTLNMGSPYSVLFLAALLVLAVGLPLLTG
ncbi:DUF5808 domain-containing protein [Kitasatospora sp. NBC_01287]|uniref:DUF1648 domain-containing protein n=1 Tax=Kitasatospora sp. NBC_01287 TaxID=2903573 RepID=UPI0022559918|nr:DUF5808 domain-containing protein [Kitasatospora sp. NBC_01287]MCX4747821.1 DUF5808 domain-containing protein [Kitasatospora sp. NBC_01287]